MNSEMKSSKEDTKLLDKNCDDVGLESGVDIRQIYTLGKPIPETTDALVSQENLLNKLPVVSDPKIFQSDNNIKHYDSNCYGVNEKDDGSSILFDLYR